VKKSGTLLVLVILALFLLSGNNQKRVAKAQFLGKTLYLPFISSLNKIEEMTQLRDKNRDLSKKLAEKTLQVNKMQNYLDTVENIDFSFQISTDNYTIADIIGYTGLYKEKNLVVNKGLSAGVLPELPVLSSQGIAGKTINSGQNYAVILPFNHSDFKLSVMLKRNNLQGLLESDKFRNSYMTQIKPGADIALGDTVVTSNISSIFTKNYPVGIISGIDRSPDKIYIQAKIKPFVEPSKLNQVIILLNKKDIKYEQEFAN
jgi:rod shape-determining protein MreC